MSITKLSNKHQLDSLLEEIKYSTHTNWVTTSASKYFNDEDWQPSKTDKILFEKKSTGKTAPIPFTGIPYVYIGSKYYECHQGPDRNKSNKKKYAEQQMNSGDHVHKQRRHLIQDTKKVDCPAVLNVIRVAALTEELFQIEIDKNSKYKRDCTSDIIKAALNKKETVPVKWENVYYVYVSQLEDHKGHPIIGEAASTREKVDPRVETKIRELINQNKQLTVPQMKIFLEEYVKNHIFKGCDPPSILERRFNPHSKDIRNIIDAEKHKKLHCKDDQENLQNKCMMESFGTQTDIVDNPELCKDDDIQVFLCFIKDNEASTQCALKPIPFDQVTSNKRKRNKNISIQVDLTCKDVEKEMVGNLDENITSIVVDENNYEKRNDRIEDIYLQSKYENKTKYNTEDSLCDLIVCSNGIKEEKIQFSRKISNICYEEEIERTDMKKPSIESSFVNNKLQISEHYNEMKFENSIDSQEQNTKFQIISTNKNVMRKPIQHEMGSMENEDCEDYVHAEVKAEERLLRKQKELKLFQCSYCEKYLSSNTRLLIHQRIHTGEKPYLCSNCGKSFIAKHTLLTHLKSHSDTGTKYACSQCNKYLSSYTRLIIHQRIHTGEKPYLCSSCGKSFISKHTLVTHLKTHIGIKYTCSYCNTTCNDSSNLKKHLQIHTGEKPYLCSHCGKCFSRKGNLVEHQKIHSEEIRTVERPYQCSYCDKRFAQKNKMVQHERVHTGEKPHKCSHCDKCFAVRQQMVDHELKHTGDNPYFCSHCGKCFDNGSNLRKHIKIKHC